MFIDYAYPESPKRNGGAYTVLKKAIRHPLTDAGLKAFLADWDKVKAQQKP